MKGEQWVPGAPVKREDLDNAADSASEAIRERQVDMFTAGVLRDSQANGETRAFEITPDGGLTIRVGTGVAVAPHSSDYPQSIDATDDAATGGERLYIPVADTATSPANSYSNSIGTGNHDGTGVYTETADGIGGWTATPQSTKTRSIPLTGGVMNYVWIRYAATIPTGGGDTSLHKITGKILFTKTRDGYEIAVTTTTTPPLSDSRYLALGTVDLTGSPGIVTTGLINQDAVVYAKTRPHRVGVRLDPTTKPTSYSDLARVISLEEHVNAFGTGVVTPSNPHGSTLADLGFTEDIDLLNHRKYHHAGGLVVPDPMSTSTALFPQTTTSTVIGGTSGTVFMRQLSAGIGEQIVVGGKVFTQLFPLVPSNIAPMNVGDAYVAFSTSDVAGVYAIVAKILGSALTCEKRLQPGAFDPVTEFLIATVQWNGTTFVFPSPNGVQTDNRLFGTVANRNMQADSVAAANIQAGAVTESKLDANSVSETKLQNFAVTTSKIALQNVGTAQLALLSVADVNLADDAVTSQKLKEWDASPNSLPNSGSGVKTAHLADGAVTFAKIAGGALPPTPPSIRFFIQGPAVKTDTVQDSTWRAVAACIVDNNMVVDRVYMFSDNAPAGGGQGLTINIRRLALGDSSSQWSASPTSVFAFQKPNIADGNKQNGGALFYEDSTNNTDIMNGITFNKGDRLYLDISTVGATVPGGDDLLVTIVGK